MAIDRSREQRFSEIDFETARENLRQAARETSEEIAEDSEEESSERLRRADSIDRPHPDDLSTHED